MATKEKTQKGTGIVILLLAAGVIWYFTTRKPVLAAPAVAPLIGAPVVAAPPTKAIVPSPIVQSSSELAAKVSGIKAERFTSRQLDTAQKTLVNQAVILSEPALLAAVQVGMTREEVAEIRATIREQTGADILLAEAAAIQLAKAEQEYEERTGIPADQQTSSGVAARPGGYSAWYAENFISAVDGGGYSMEKSEAEAEVMRETKRIEEKAESLEKAREEVKRTGGVIDITKEGEYYVAPSPIPAGEYGAYWD